MECREIDLEKLARDKKLTVKHADYLIVAGSTVIIVEETSRPKKDDVDKLRSTIEELFHGSLKEYLPNHNAPQKIVAVIHKQRRADAMIPRELMKLMTQEKVAYFTADCDPDLKRILQGYCKKIEPHLATLT